MTNPGDQVTADGNAVSLRIASQDLAGGPLTYSASGLPAGLSLNTSTGLIAGTPTAVSSAGVKISVQDVAHVTGTTTFTWTTEPPTGPPSPPTQVALGSDHTCAVFVNHSADCWGLNGSGGLGDNAKAPSSLPVEVLGLSNASSLAGGAGYTCALLQTSQVACWGDLDGTQSNAPATISAISSATDVATGDDHVCAVLSGGNLDCWGSAESEDLGNGSTRNSPTPEQVPGITTATEAAAGAAFTCALLTAGNVSCWGANGAGEIGNGTPGSNDPLTQATDLFGTPQQVVGISNATQVSAGGGTACALLASGQVDCWGNNDLGQLGNGQAADESPVPVGVSGISNATEVAVAASHACALLASGQVQCWGKGTSGELGDGNASSSGAPVSVSGISNATEVSVGGDQSCALLASAQIECWGGNTGGELGNGTTSQSDVPVQVSGIL